MNKPRGGLRLLNTLLVQWFFMRVAVWGEKGGPVRGYRLLIGIVPLTGWWGPYWYVFGLTGPLKLPLFTKRSD
jgi:hypothetical protein